MGKIQNRMLHSIRVTRRDKLKLPNNEQIVWKISIFDSISLPVGCGGGEGYVLFFKEEWFCVDFPSSGATVKKFGLYYFVNVFFYLFWMLFHHFVASGKAIFLLNIVIPLQHPTMYLFCCCYYRCLLASSVHVGAGRKGQLDFQWVGEKCPQRAVRLNDDLLQALVCDLQKKQTEKRQPQTVTRTAQWTIAELGCNWDLWLLHIDFHRAMRVCLGVSFVCVFVWSKHSIDDRIKPMTGKIATRKKWWRLWSWWRMCWCQWEVCCGVV